MSFTRVSVPMLGTTILLASAPPAFTADSVATGGLEEIVVTARKREENVMKTPVSVAALSSEDIAVRGITSFNDLANATPGLNINNANSGRNDRSFQQISLRGFTPATTTSTLTASFIDGVPVASATALSAVSDPERVEVLKGPQAAYFGRDTFAGAVNVVTRKPSATLGGTASLMTIG